MMHSAKSSTFMVSQNCGAVCTNVVVIERHYHWREWKIQGTSCLLSKEVRGKIYSSLSHYIESMNVLAPFEYCQCTNVHSYLSSTMQLLLACYGICS